MVGFVWCKNIEAGKAQLLRIKQDYEKYWHVDIKVLENSLICSNGDKWYLRRAIPSHATRCNIAYIEKGIPEPFIRECIIPTCNLAPYHAINYYS